MMRPLSQAERVAAFKAATNSFKHHFGKRFASGMTDDELTAALQMSLGIFGGSGGPGRMNLTLQGAGLKIWASWGVHNHVTDKPLFAGKATIAMAREVYRIADPSSPQMSLF
jgi:hypothetical protein